MIMRLLVILLLLSSAGFTQGRYTEVVTFTSGDITLEGILVRPDTISVTPAVVFQQGSGGFSFNDYVNEAWGPHKYYIEDPLLDAGYAVLYCNKRGLGQSEGNWQHNDFQGRADDAFAAVQYLQSLPFIDAENIGVSGHSQGGWIAQLVASQHDEVSFVLSLAGPTVSVEEQTLSFERQLFQCEGLTGEALDKKMAKRKKKRRKNANLGNTLSFINSARHWALIIDYDPKEALLNTTVPTLLLFAEYDVNVVPEENVQRLEEIFSGDVPDNYTVKVMSGGQHGFYMVENACVDWDTATQQPFDQTFQKQIIEWIEAL